MGCVGADGTAADAGAVAWQGCFTQANCHSFFWKSQLRLANLLTHLVPAAELLRKTAEKKEERKKV